MPTHGLIISKLAIRVLANDETVMALICLKVSLPEDTEGRAARWALFPHTPPKVTSPPTICPLPLLARIIPSESTREAAKLLGQSISEQNEAGSSGARPYIDVSSTTGQVYIVSEPTLSPKLKSILKSPARRADWLVAMEVEVPIRHDGGEREVAIPLPKCLDNTLRLQITSSDEGDVNVTTEPKILPLPGSPNLTAPHRTVDDDGWEEAESESETMIVEGGDDGGSWLQGRFQSTEQLTLRYTFDSAETSRPSLSIEPVWSTNDPYVRVEFESTVQATDKIVDLQAVVPLGFGWTDLSIQGDDLVSWHCADAEHLGSALARPSLRPDIDHNPDDTGIFDFDADDSFSTVRHVSPSPSLRPSTQHNPASASSSLNLLHQTMPAGRDISVAEYSFERNAEPTASSRVSEASTHRPCIRRRLSVQPSTPQRGQWFKIEFSRSRSYRIRIEGVLRPLDTLTLVHPVIPIHLPFFRSDEICLLTQLGNSDPPQEVDTNLESVGLLNWLDDQSGIRRRSATINGNVGLAVSRTPFSFRLKMEFEWPEGVELVSFGMPSTDVRILTAKTNAGPLVRYMANVTMQGSQVSALNTSIDRLDSSREKTKPQEIQTIWLGPRFTGSSPRTPPLGVVAVEFESTLALGMPLPICCDSNGTLYIELVGDGWDEDHLHTLTTNMTRLTPRSFTHPLSSPAYLSLDPLPRPKTRPKRTLLSLQAFAWLLMLYLLVSLGLRVQHLSAQVGFVLDETRDLRLYGLPEAIPRETDGAAAEMHEDASAGPVIPVDGEMSTEVGRVVLRTNPWQKWAEHPT